MDKSTPSWPQSGLSSSDISAARGEIDRGRMSALKGSKVLVAGGAGFVGSAVVRAVLAAGARCLCFDNFHVGRREHVAGLGRDLIVVNGVAIDPWHVLKVFLE